MPRRGCDGPPGSGSVAFGEASCDEARAALETLVNNCPIHTPFCAPYHSLLSSAVCLDWTEYTATRDSTMVRLREIPRTAAFAWSPGSAPPLLATGTRAGAVDDDFSNDTNLELWDLQLDQVDASPDLSPVGSISTDSKYPTDPTT